MINHTDKKLVKYLINFINSNEKFNKLFNHHKQIYSMEDLFLIIMFMLLVLVLIMEKIMH
jgi:predicted regulator of amino acid metabolism with ACT domain